VSGAPPVNSVVGDALAALRAEYLAHLPELLAELALLVARGATDVEARERARVAAHRLRGTAGSYGFEAAGELAGRIEDTLDEGAAVPAELLRSLEALVSHPAARSPESAQ